MWEVIVKIVKIIFGKKKKDSSTQTENEIVDSSTQTERIIYNNFY